MEIDWVVEDEFAEVLEDNPLISTVHRVHASNWKRLPQAPRTCREISALKETLTERGYRFAFDFEGTLQSGLISRLSGASDRIGFTSDEVPERWNMAFSMRRIPLRRQDIQLTHRCLRLVSVPFAKDYREMELVSTIATDRDDDLAAEALLATLSDGLVFVFDCGGDWQTKLWTDKGWVELGRQVLDTYRDAAILLAWDSEAERDAVTEIAKMIGGARVLDRHSLKGLAALLKRVDMVVGGDTDTIQMAAALGTPTLSFYRATSGKLRGPVGSHHKAIQSPIHCNGCLRSRCDKDQQCRGTIKAEAMMSFIVSLFGN